MKRLHLILYVVTISLIMIMAIVFVAAIRHRNQPKLDLGSIARHLPQTDYRIESEGPLPQKQISSQDSQAVDAVAEKLSFASDPSVQAPQEIGGRLSGAADRQSAQLRAQPAELHLSVEEGGRGTAEIMLTNDSDVPAYVNVYKTEARNAANNNEVDLNGYVAYKIAIVAEPRDLEDLKKAALFTGAPWLKPFPYCQIINPQSPETISVTIEAKDLQVGRYYAELIGLGKSQDEAVIIPVTIEVRSCARIKVTGLEIDDGASVDTAGNNNKAANPGERVAVLIRLTNQGQSTASGLSVALISEDPAVQVLDIAPKVIPSMASGSSVAARFMVELSKEADGSVPPAVKLHVSDSDGRTWSDNFYLGQDGAFAYPLGLLTKPGIPDPGSPGCD